MMGIAAVAFATVGVVTAVFFGARLSEVLGLPVQPLGGEEVVAVPPGPPDVQPSILSEPEPEPRDVPRPPRPVPAHRPSEAEPAGDPPSDAEPAGDPPLDAEPGGELPVGPAPPDPGEEPQQPEPAGEGAPAEPGPPAGEPERADKPPPSPAPSTRDPFDDIRQRRNVLALPDMAATGRDTTPTVLANVFVTSPQECELSLLGGERLFGKGACVMLAREDNEAGDIRTWTIRVKTQQQIGAAQVIGRFALQGDVFTYVWHQRGSRFIGAAILKYCLLKVEIGEHSEVCVLSRPHAIEPLAICLQDRHPQVPIPLAPDLFPSAAALRFDLSLEGAPAHRMNPTAGLSVEEVSKIEFANADGNGNLAEIEVQLLKRENYLLSLKVFAYPTLLRDDGTTATERTAVDCVWIDNRRKELATAKANTDRLLASAAQGLATAKRELAQIDSTLDGAVAGHRHAAPDALRGLLARRRDLEQEILRRGKQQKLGESRLDLIESNTDWLAELQDLFDELTADARLHCRVYVEVEGKEVEVVRTTAENEATQTPAQTGNVQDQRP